MRFIDRKPIIRDKELYFVVHSQLFPPKNNQNMSPITYTTLHRSNLGPINTGTPPRQHPFSTGNIGLFVISYGTEVFINH